MGICFSKITLNPDINYNIDFLEDLFSEYTAHFTSNDVIRIGDIIKNSKNISYNNNSLYQGYKPVLWSTVEKTALADAEVEYKDHTSNTVYVGFKVKTSKTELLKNAEIIIWTTTPWTIPANKALAYNTDLDYSIIEINSEEKNFSNKKIVVATKLLDQVLKDCGIETYQLVKKNLKLRSYPLVFGLKRFLEYLCI